MADRGHADRLPLVSHLVKEPVRADPQRVGAAQFSAERLAGERVALEQAKRILDRVDQWPTQPT
jgi:hypothetical protein